MFADVAIPLTCWLCVLLALPRKPLPGNEVQELVYSRLLGRQARLVVLALVLTAAAFVVGITTLPTQADPDLTTARRVRAYCDLTAAHQSVCHYLQADGTWLEVRRQSDESWSVVATVLVPTDDSSPAPAGDPERP
jgi:hypothetical protein